MQGTGTCRERHEEGGFVRVGEIEGPERAVGILQLRTGGQSLAAPVVVGRDARAAGKNCDRRIAQDARHVELRQRGPDAAQDQRECALALNDKADDGEVFAGLNADPRANSDAMRGRGGGRAVAS